jgi:hypothetical protein
MDEQLALVESNFSHNKPNFSSNKSNYTALSYSTNVLDPELQLDPKEEQKARLVLESVAQDYSDDQINEAIAEMKFLAESWLNDFEREVFDGKTLKEMLHDKGRP